MTAKAKTVRCGNCRWYEPVGAGYGRCVYDALPEAFTLGNGNTNSSDGKSCPQFDSGSLTFPKGRKP